MQTEIDQFLTEQNALLSQQNSLLAEQNEALSQQVSSLKNILTTYSEVEQSLKDKINNLNSEKEAQQALILAMKVELSKLEQGEFSEQLQQAFQENLRTQLQMQLTTALNQLDLNSIVSDLVKIELKSIQQTLDTQQTDLETAAARRQCLDGHTPAGLGAYPTHQGQPQAEPFAARMPAALKGFEDAAQFFRRNAGTGILDTKTINIQT